MVTVEFLGPIEKEKTTYDINNLEALKNHLQQDEKIAPWLQNCAVAINDELVSSLQVKLNPGDRVSILPPVCGG